MEIKSTKLIQKIQILNSDEWNRLEKWLCSPWCNTNKTLVKLYKLLRPHYPTFTSRKLTKEKLFQQLYPANKYDAKWIRNLMSELSKGIERFLAHEHLEKNLDIQKQFLQEEYLERGRKDWFFKSARRLIEGLKTKAVKTWKDYLQLALLHENSYRHIDGVERQKLEIADFQYAQSYLDQFYALGKTRFLVEEKERGEITSGKYNLQHANTFLDWLELEKMPLEVKYYSCFFKEEWSYEKLKENYYKNFKNYNKDDQQFMLLLLINKAVKNKIKGDINALEDMLECYEFGLKHRVFFIKGKISSVSFANIITIGNALKAYDFVNNFVNEYAAYLSPELQEDAVDWAAAHTAYHQGVEGLKKLEIKLAKKKSDNTSFSLRAKILLLQIGFDRFIKNQEHDQFLMDFSLAFEKQLNRDKNFSKLRLLALKKFVQYTRKLYKLIVGLKLTKKNLEKLEKELNEEKNIRAKKWLLTKIEVLKSQV